MRRCLIILVLLISQVAYLTWAASVLRGTVVSLDRDSGRMVVRNAGTMKVVNVVVPPERLPEFVQVGSKIKIWGHFLQGHPNLFNAQNITRGGSSWWKNDPTGVRSRLNRNRGMFGGGRGGGGRGGGGKGR